MVLLDLDFGFHISWSMVKSKLCAVAVCTWCVVGVARERYGGKQHLSLSVED